MEIVGLLKALDLRMYSKILLILAKKESRAGLAVFYRLERTGFMFHIVSTEGPTCISSPRIQILSFLQETRKVSLG